VVKTLQDLTSPFSLAPVYAGKSSLPSADILACYQYILPPKSTIYIGCVGRDKYAEILQKAVDAAGLRVAYRYDESTPTGRCGVIITGHNRTMCTDLAAANCYKLEHLKSPEVWEAVERAKYYYVGGYHLTVCVPAAMALAEEAAAQDKVRDGRS
jgi:adenosine kinase